jgi:hypothetical protein
MVSKATLVMLSDVANATMYSKSALGPHYTNIVLQEWPQFTLFQQMN